MERRERFMCPFCNHMIVEVVTPYDLKDVEQIALMHIVERHPIRWRLSRKFRRAIKRTPVEAV